jgi:uncharacterized cupin superfamily protein
MTRQLRSPALDPLAVKPREGSAYPEAFKGLVEGRSKRALGTALGLANFGVNLVGLAPGAWSAQRHWHSHEDEFVYGLEGEVTLVTEQGEQLLGPGMAAGFPAGRADGHCLVNRSDAHALYLEVGDRRPEDAVHYPDIDLHLSGDSGGRTFKRKNGEPY